MYIQVRNDEWERMKNELQELRGDKAQLEETVAVLQLNAENKRAKADKINALYQKSLARLNELARKMYPDEEEDHAEADGILCDMLNALGYKDLTDAWDDIKKWYS
jgi:chromosome segregation ATPase